MNRRNFLTMIKVAALMVVLITVICCRARPVTANASTPPATDTIPDSVVQFLLTSATNDFRRYQPPVPVDFRNVKVGYINFSKDRKTYVLCGEVLSAENREWENFATVKTLDYEHYIGQQALPFCENLTTVSANTDLSIELKEKVTR